ncbi:hypothetical protein H8E77_06875 [bacterium]|nr:hypothetical protein [bacterium]
MERWKDGKEAMALSFDFTLNFTTKAQRTQRTSLYILCALRVPAVKKNLEGVVK